MLLRPWQSPINLHLSAVRVDHLGISPDFCHAAMLFQTDRYAGIAGTRLFNIETGAVHPSLESVYVLHGLWWYPCSTWLVYASRQSS